MTRPLPTPPTPEPPDEGVDDFDRPLDFDTKAGGPREFARRTERGWSEGGARSRIVTPDTQ